MPNNLEGVTIATYIHVAAQQARADARIAQSELLRGTARGVLHRIPYGMKDNYDVAGLPATAGSRAQLGYIAQSDAALVTRLRTQGAILMGKLATWEYGTGTALFALGSDTTGSVRLPAAATGTIGLIATDGVLDRRSILPNCYRWISRACSPGPPRMPFWCSAR